jgi:hypothetical protein
MRLVGFIRVNYTIPGLEQSTSSSLIKAYGAMQPSAAPRL